MAINMENQVLSIEQMNHLKELGVDTRGASMAWQRGLATRNVWVLYAVGNMSLSLPDKEHTFTLQDMLNMMPINIGWNSLYISKGDEWDMSYETRRSMSETITLIEFSNENPLEAAYQMFFWLAEGGYLNKK